MDGAVQAAEGAVDLVAVRPNFQKVTQNIINTRDGRSV